MAEGPSPYAAPRINNLFAGYRALSDAEVALINEIRAKAEEVGALVDRVTRGDGVPEGVDGRWAAVARTDLQQGFMALIRAVAKPTSF